MKHPWLIGMNFEGIDTYELYDAILLEPGTIVAVSEDDTGNGESGHSYRTTMKVVGKIDLKFDGVRYRNFYDFSDELIDYIKSYEGADLFDINDERLQIRSKPYYIFEFERDGEYVREEPETFDGSLHGYDQDDLKFLLVERLINCLERYHWN